MAGLAELQERLQADIMQRSGSTLPEIRTPPGRDKAKRLAVYQSAYKLRLIEILGLSHEKLWAYLGDEQFHEMADRYFDACPSSHPNARFVSARLPQFLATDGRYTGQPVLAEIAAIEEALEDVFDAADAPQRLEKDRLSLSLTRMRGVYSDNLIEVVEWCMSLDPLSRPQSVFALQKELSREGERQYTKLSVGEKVRLQFDNMLSDTKKNIQRATRFGMRNK